MVQRKGLTLGSIHTSPHAAKSIPLVPDEAGPVNFF
jgi:hypothetical protein